MGQWLISLNNNWKFSRFSSLRSRHAELGKLDTAKNKSSVGYYPTRKIIRELRARSCILAVPSEVSPMLSRIRNGNMLSPDDQCRRANSRELIPFLRRSIAC